MIALILAVVAVGMQGFAGLQPGTGIVAGVLKTTEGRPAAGVRVGAVDAEDPVSSSLLSVTETDSNGKYRLTNIPAGRYFIVAGRLNSLHYYPSGDRAHAVEIEVGAARIRSDVDFAVPGGSQRPGPARAALPPPINLESIAYQKVAAEKDLARKTQLVTQFEKDFPKSLRLPEAYISLSQLFVAQQQIEKALRYAEKAASVARSLKNQTPTASFNPASWQQWTASIDANAQRNLKWVKDVEAWQSKALYSLVAPGRRR